MRFAKRLLCYGIKYFGPAVKEKIKRAIRIKLPLGSGIEEQQALPESKPDEKKEAENLGSFLKILSDQSDIHNKQMDLALKDKETLQSELEEVKKQNTWMGKWLEDFILKFAAVFLRPRTIVVLSWIVGHPDGIEIEKLRFVWRPLIDDAEMNAILEAFQQAWMTQNDGKSIRPSYFGELFIQKHGELYKGPAVIAQLFPELTEPAPTPELSLAAATRLAASKKGSE